MGSWEPTESGEAGDEGPLANPIAPTRPLPWVFEDGHLVLGERQIVEGAGVAWSELVVVPPTRALAQVTSPSPGRFRDCRNRLLAGSLEVDLDELGTLAARRLTDLGLEGIRFEARNEGPGSPHLALTLTQAGAGATPAQVSLAFALTADGADPARVCLEAGEMSVEGTFPLSPRELLEAIARALGSPESQSDETGIVLDPAREAAFALFTSRGWRAPSLAGLGFVEATLAAGSSRTLVLRFAPRDFVDARAALRPAPTRRELLTQAAAAQAAGDLDGAERDWTLAARAGESDDERERLERATALTHLAELQEKRGRFEAAMRTAAEAVALAPAHAPALLLLAELRVRLGEHEGAGEAYAALAHAPGAAQLITPAALAKRRGRVASALGRWDEAAEHFGTEVKLAPSDPEARHALAEVAIRRGDFPEGARQLEEELRLLPLEALDRLTQVRHRLGHALARLGDWGGARYHLELAVSQEPQRYEAWEVLADVTERLGLPEQTAAALERLSRVYPTAEKRAEALFRRGEILREKLDDRMGALDAYLKASDLCPSHAGTAARLVEAFWRLGDYESLAGLSTDLLASGQLAGAAPSARLRLILGLALARQSTSPVADDALATLPWDPADVTEAVIEAAENLNEGAVEALDPLLTSLLRWRGPLAEHSLRETLKAAWRADPARPGVLLALAWLADRSGDETLARVLYALVAFLDPQPRNNVLVRLGMLGPAPPARAEALELGGASDHPDCLDRVLPLRRSLARLASPLQGFAQGPLGIASPDDEGVPRDRNVLARRLARLLGVPPVRFVVTQTPAPRPGHIAVGFEPTRPATIRIPREALSVSDGELTFLLTRALDVARNGLGSLADRPPEDVAAFLQGAQAANEHRAAPDHPLARATLTWLSQAEQAEALRAGGSSIDIRDELIAAEHTLGSWDAFLRGAEQASNRFGLLVCRSPLDALKALARLDLAGAAQLELLGRAKRQELLRTTALRQLTEFMLSPAYAASLDARLG